jgi:hypothetical protein
MGKCPFDKKDCKSTCILYRKGMRYWEDSRKEPVAFEECAINIAVDCLENMVSRSIGQQKATEQVRNETASLKELFYALATRKAISNLKEDLKEEIKNENVIEVTE